MMDTGYNKIDGLVPGNPFPSCFLMSGLSTDRGSLVTTYGYDPSTGELTSVNYSDTTPDVTYAYESQRNVKTRVKHQFGSADIVRYDYTYNAAGWHWQLVASVRSTRGDRAISHILTESMCI